MTSLSNLVPKAALSAYQRWELASLSDAAEPDANANCAPLASAGEVANDADERAAEQAAKEQTRKDAYAEGYAAGKTAGHAEGCAQGYTEGRAAGFAAGMKEAEEARDRLNALMPSIAENAAARRQQVLDEVLDFALQVARQMVGQALAVRRELLLPVLAAALERLPQMSQSVQLALNPADLDVVRTFLAEQPTPVACALVADSTIVPGGCRVVTEQCEIDATVETRWRRLLANLGCADEWLAST
jgi:flagellar assembly protein FliH